jgi:phage-related minor tail protein
LINKGDGTFTKDYSRLPEGINDPNNPPAAIKNRIDALVKDMSGPETKNLADSIAGAVQGATAALTGAIPNLNSLVPDAAALSSSIISTTPVTVPIDLTSGFVDPLKQAAAKAQAEIEAAQAQLAKTQSAVQAQIAEAAAAAQKAAASAQSALSQGLSDLQSKASSISDSINAKLSSLSSGSVNTTHTVTLIDGVPNVDANGLTVPLNKVNTVATQLETQLKNLQQSLTNLLSQ